MSLTEVMFRVNLFDNKDDRNNSRRRLLWLLEALAQVNRIWLEIHPETPPLYESDVVYKIEKGEQFKDIYHVMKDGHGDCDCLSSWRVAELQDIGIAARPYIKWRKEGGMWLYHAVIWLPNGKIEDPSLAKGMGGGKIVNHPIYIEP